MRAEDFYRSMRSQEVGLLVDEMERMIDREGNKKTFKHKDYLCEIRRVKQSGHLCGYVTLKESDEGFDAKKTSEVDTLYYTHGGVTFVADGMIGFDCAHSGDLTLTATFNPAVYRDMGYVEDSLKELVEEIIEHNKKEN